MKIVIDYYSDLLCIWAWIAQRRLEELEQEWGDQIEIRQHYVNVFGDTRGKIDRQWDGSFEKFADHVQRAASIYETAPVNPKLWRKNPPLTSANAHLVLKEISITEGDQKSDALANSLRAGFFAEAINIGEIATLTRHAQDAGIDTDLLAAVIDSGEALAALMSDYQSALDQGIKGSPSWVLDNGRQILYGNVGYRVLRANVEELINQPGDEASWC